MMWYSAPLRRRSFSGSDVEIPINLKRIAVDDGAAKLLAQTEREGAFARAGGPDNRYQWKIAHCFQCIGAWNLALDGYRRLCVSMRGFHRAHTHARQFSSSLVQSAQPGVKTGVILSKGDCAARPRGLPTDLHEPIRKNHYSFPLRGSIWEPFSSLLSNAGSSAGGR